MENNLNIEKIKFVENNLAFFTQNAHKKINKKDNVSTALLTILLSEKRLEECRNYPILLESIHNYQGLDFSDNFIEIISNLQTYVTKIFNYDKEAQTIIIKLDSFVNLYRKNQFQKVKKRA